MGFERVAFVALLLPMFIHYYKYSAMRSVGFPLVSSVVECFRISMYYTKTPERFSRRSPEHPVHIHTHARGHVRKRVILRRFYFR